QRSRRHSIQSHILWRSYLGSPAAWSGSGSNSRGIYLIDDTVAEEEHAEKNGTSRIRSISSNKRMFHLPCSLQDVVLHNIFGNNRLAYDDNRHNNNRTVRDGYSYLQLLPQPRIVGATLSTSRRFSTSGISCMDLDKGYDLNSSTTTSPPRYLLVGSGGSDCTICLYDLSYFGSDQYLNQGSKNQQQHNVHNAQQTKSTIASMTHRPIARSIRQSNDTAVTDISGVPNGHRQPILSVKWYPADVYGSFVSASISGEILIWDAQQFVPVFATYTHVYSGPKTSAAADEDSNKSVAPLKCMDLPKTPEGCPHGSALLALGLGGGDGRGVIQLCDAFHGGSATHELIGHTGGVNGLEWDPQHPFRLASAGEDCTVRLWDIRKAGASACLGVLDREKGMCGDDLDVSSKATLVQPSPKKRRLGVQQYHHINDLSRFQGLESHGVPVSSVAFAPSGDELVSAGVDGKIFHWDLRPDSCFDSADAALRSKVRQGGTTYAGVDPAVSIGGRLYPTVFAAGESRSSTLGSSKRPSYRRNETVLAIRQAGSRDTTTLFASTTSVNRDSKIHGYSLYNGTEQCVLNAHLGDVTCLLPISNFDNRRVNCCDDTRYDVKLLTGGKDGVVLSWGAPVRNSSYARDAHDDQEGYDDDDGMGDDVVSILRRQRQQRAHRTNCRLRGRDVGDATSQAEDCAQDVDTW
ncbi:hypothetical protein ACHAWT_010465, partial [Skeletonema menzelii]